MIRLGWLATITAVLAAAAPAETVRPGAGPYETLRLSAELARAGDRAGDPWLLIAAARLRAQAGAEGDPRGAEWLTAAERIGAEDPRVASVVADIRAAASKGRAAGPRVSQATIQGGERRAFSETFAAGRPAVVYIEGDGDTKLTLKVAGACSDMGPGDVKICAWTPAKATQVTVEIANAGRVANRVVLGIN